MTLTNTFLCDDGALYYVREVGSDIYWFGEHRGARFANVFVGQRSGNDISGKWYDVPKGLTRSSGEISLSVGTGDSSFNRVSATGGFGGSVWEEYTPLFEWPSRRAPSTFRQAGFEARMSLDGTWLGNDGGTYYIRDHEDIVWFGERRSFSNVFNATRSGNRITGSWADVPKGRTSSSGNLSLTVQNSFTLQRTAQTGGFAGDRWNRVQSLDIDINLDTLILHETEDYWGDEPFLWTVFIKVDGETVDLADFGRATATVISTSGSHKNITGEQNIGRRRLPIPPQVGRFSTNLKTLRGLDPFSARARNNTILSFIVFAFDEDLTHGGAIEAGRRAMLNVLQTELDTAIRRLTPPNVTELEQQIKEAVIRAIASETPFYWPGWHDQDDLLGFETRQFRFSELIEARGLIPIDLHFRGDDAHYQVLGSIRIDNGPVRIL